MATYYAGLDLGQSADYTALAVLQKVPTYDKQTGKHGAELHLRHLERYPLKTPVISGGRVAKPTTELIVDKTGVGVAVTDLLKERRLNHIAVTITGLGQKVNRHGTKEYSVPKQDLLSDLEVPFHKGTLKVAKGLQGWRKLREELLNFRHKQNKTTAHISYEHWREAEHDDLVLAAALACWKTTYKRKGTTRLKVIY